MACWRFQYFQAPQVGMMYQAGAAWQSVKQLTHLRRALVQGQPELLEQTLPMQTRVDQQQVILRLGWITVKIRGMMPATS